MKKILKIIYKYIPNNFKIFFFYLIRYFFRLNINIYQHLNFTGYFKIKLYNKYAYMYSIGTILENTVFWKGIENAHEPLSNKIWFHLSKKSNLIIDIGANVGLYSLVSHMANNKCKIHAFEPSEKFLIALKKIKQKNNIDLELNSIALGDSNKSVFFDGYRTVSDLNEKKFYTETINSKWNEIKQTKLSEYLIKKKINKIDLIKIDIEKNEYKVLKDIKKNIKKDQPNMLIEIIHGDKISKDRINNEIGKIIHDLNYKIYLVDDKNKTITYSPMITYSTYWNVLFLNSDTSKSFEKEFQLYLS